MRLRRRLRLAERLRDLLHDRMVVLLQELYAAAIKASRARRRLSELLAEAYPGFIEAYSSRGDALLDAYASQVSEPRVRVATRSAMGVLLPVVELESLEERTGTRPLELAKLAERRVEILETLAELAEAEKALDVLASEIARTRRKTEALDKVLIPRLRHLLRSLTTKFEELEREERVRSLKVKRMLEKRGGLAL